MILNECQVDTVSLGKFSTCNSQTLSSSLYANKELQESSLNWSYWTLNILCDSDDLCFRSKISNKWWTKARQCADAHKLAAWVLVIDSLQTKFWTLELSCQSVSPTFEWRLKRALFFTHLTSNYVYSWKQVKEFSLRRCAGVTKGYQILTLTPSVLPTLVNF